MLCFGSVCCVLAVCVVFWQCVLCFGCVCCVLAVCVVFCTCGPPYIGALLTNYSFKPIGAYKCFLKPDVYDNLWHPACILYI